MRHTSSHSKNRRSHHALSTLTVLKDENGKTRLPHRVDEATGMYRGKQIFAPKAKKVSAEKVRKVEHPKDHVHDSEPVNQAKTSVLEKFSAMRPRSRSGMGGTAG
jgi:ribosomal protein L32